MFDEAWGSRFEYFYDPENGKQIEGKGFNSKTGMLVWDCEYGPNGRLTRQKNYDADTGAFISDTRWIYDAAGKFIERIEYDGNGKIKKRSPNFQD